MKATYLLLLVSLLLAGYSHQQLENPKVVYAGGVQNIILSTKDITEITKILKKKNYKITYLEISRGSKMKMNQYLVFPEPEKNVMHTGLGCVFEKRDGKWYFLEKYYEKLIKNKR